MKNKTDSSVIIITYRRDAHLQAQLAGISDNTAIPAEIIVVYVNDHPKVEYDPSLNVVFIGIHADISEGMPYALGRNTGAKCASYEVLHFLDVDCIPSPTYFERMSANVKASCGMVMGQPKYLVRKVRYEHDKEQLNEISIFHPVRPRIDKDLMQFDAYELFWSLCFSIRKDQYLKVGGFDNLFKGYGGEDTDFAFTLRKYRIPFYLSPAIVYHQQHTVYRPPLHAFLFIIKNAKYFFEKWDVWPMDDWLKKFEQMGYIRLEQNNIVLCSIPTKEECEKHRVDDAPFI